MSTKVRHQTGQRGVCLSAGSRRPGDRSAPASCQAAYYFVLGRLECLTAHLSLPDEDTPRACLGNGTVRLEPGLARGRWSVVATPKHGRETLSPGAPGDGVIERLGAVPGPSCSGLAGLGSWSRPSRISRWSGTRAPMQVLAPTVVRDMAQRSLFLRCGAKGGQRPDQATRPREVCTYGVLRTS
jgi:hypothetical protein